MKKIFIVIGLSVLFGSCQDESLFPIPDPEWAPVAEVQWTDQNRTFFNYADLTNAVFEFTLIGEDFGYEEAEVSSIEVSVAYNGTGKQVLGEYTDLPATVTLPAPEAAEKFGLALDDLQLGDVFTFSFIVKTVDGDVYSVYNNNICNLIRIAGVCTLDAYVLNPTVALTSVDASENAYQVEDIGVSGDDSYVFTLDKRDFTAFSPGSVGVQLALVDGTEVHDWKTLTNVTSFPSAVTITASEAVALFEKTTADLTAGVHFEVRFVFEGPAGAFHNYGSKACGTNFPSNVVFPQHTNATGVIPDLSWDNPYGATTAPATTSTSGTCALTIAVM